MPDGMPRRGDQPQPWLQLEVTIDRGVCDAGDVPQGRVEPWVVAGRVEVLPLHERGDPRAGEGIVPAAMVEIEMGRDQQIDVAGSDTKLGQARQEVILRSGVVRMIPPWRSRWLPDHRGRVAGIDEDDLPARRADHVARNLGKVRLTRISVR